MVRNGKAGVTLLLAAVFVAVSIGLVYYLADSFWQGRGRTTGPTAAQRKALAMTAPLRTSARGCSLTVFLAVQPPREAALKYVFENHSDRNAYLFNILYENISEKGAFLVDHNAVYAELDGGRLVLSKKIASVPENMAVEKPNVPCATLVGPGELFEQTVAFDLPLKPRTPYFSPADEELEKKPAVSKAWFELGFFLATPEGDSLAANVKTSKGAAKYFDPFPVTSQQLLRVGPFPDTLPVLPPKE